MPITYPLTPPAAFRSAEISLTARSVVAVTESPDSLVTQVQEKQGQRWEARIKLPPMKRADAEAVLGFLLSLNGRTGTCYLGDSANKTPRGVGTGTAPVVNGTATARVYDLSTAGWTSSTPGILKAGDWIQVGTGSTRRLHKVLADADSDASGVAELLIWPKTRSAYASGTAIVVSSPLGVFRLSAPTEWTIDLAKFYGITISATEAL